MILERDVGPHAHQTRGIEGFWLRATEGTQRSSSSFDYCLIDLLDAAVKLFRVS
jgi:hypothetical protein